MHVVILHCSHTCTHTRYLTQDSPHMQCMLLTALLLLEICAALIMDLASNYDYRLQAMGKIDTVWINDVEYYK